MTSDRLKSAVIAWLSAGRPTTSIAVSDANAFDEIDLPCLSVGVTSAEKHSAALHHVQRVQIEICLRCHSGDTDTRATVTTWCDSIEQLLNDPDANKAIFNASGNQIQVDYWRVDGGYPEWEETTLKATWNAECLCYRLG